MDLTWPDIFSNYSRTCLVNQLKIGVIGKYSWTTPNSVWTIWLTFFSAAPGFISIIFLQAKKDEFTGAVCYFCTCFALRGSCEHHYCALECCEAVSFDPSMPKKLRKKRGQKPGGTFRWLRYLRQLVREGNGSVPKVLGFFRANSWKTCKVATFASHLEKHGVCKSNVLLLVG